MMLFLVFVSCILATTAKSLDISDRTQPNDPYNYKLIYLTFDDGPDLGSPYVLDAFKKYRESRFDPRATFFVNSIYIEEGFEGTRDIPARKNSLIRMVYEGHTIADHSYDHMRHNSRGNNNAYVNVENDARYFGRMNIDPVISALREADYLDQSNFDLVTKTMSEYVRLPYTNNWRLGNISHDCPCTTPAQSAENAYKLADALYANGTSVVGWDLEWHNDWSGRLRYGAAAMLEKVLLQEGRLPGKIVLLAHDRAFRPGGSLDAQAELELFIKLAREAGYIFRTIDTYLSDKFYYYKN